MGEVFASLASCARRRNQRIEIGLVHDVLQLGDAVLALGLQQVVVGESVIEDAVARAQNGLWRRLAVAEPPGQG